MDDFGVKEFDCDVQGKNNKPYQKFGADGDLGVVEILPSVAVGAVCAAGSYGGGYPWNDLDHKGTG